MSDHPKQLFQSDSGFGILGGKDERLSFVGFQRDCETILLTVRIDPYVDKDEVEAIQYLTPLEALALSKRLREMAIAALEASVN